MSSSEKRMDSQQEERMEPTEFLKNRKTIYEYNIYGEIPEICTEDIMFFQEEIKGIVGPKFLEQEMKGLGYP